MATSILFYKLSTSLEFINSNGSLLANFFKALSICSLFFVIIHKLKNSNIKKHSYFPYRNETSLCNTN